MEHHRLRGRVAVDRPVGWSTIEVSAATIDLLYSESAGLGIAELDEPDATRLAVDLTERYAVLRAGSQSVLVRHEDGELSAMQPVPEPWGLRPRAKEQQFALDLPLDPDVRVVCLHGMAGTGKTNPTLADRPTHGTQPNLHRQLPLISTVC